MPTTTDSITVAPSVWSQYERVTGGEKAAVARSLDITGSTVSANVRRVKAALEAGKTVNVEGDAPHAGTPATGTTAPVVIDRIAHAEGIKPGASMFVREVDRVDAEVSRLREKIAPLEAYVAGVRSMSATAGFDLDAFEASYKDAVDKANPTPDAPDAPEGDEDKGDEK
jgi:peptidoglycan hydrolase-like amidase